ncbi:UDP-glucuronosyltransferase 2A2 [Trichoplax sp. H2]|nr:UDP-glucuronosyltransferase 2A2 [Trichoplax sp. H2]|eukprot:RDD46268.1 UDP-glucuronosyltransferase 2A2 [Trichoplax sp. H2]
MHTTMLRRKSFSLILLFAFLMQNVHSVKIAVIPMFGKSHVHSMNLIAETLMQRGHESRPNRCSSFQVRIAVEKTQTVPDMKTPVDIYESRRPANFSHVKDNKSMFDALNDFAEVLEEHCHGILNNSNIMAYYKTIDILVTDRGYLCNNLVAMAANKPHVVISPGSFNLHRGLLGNPSPLSYIPQLGSGLPSAMNFKHRLLNCLFYVIWSSTHSIYFRSTVDKVNRHYKINPSMSAEETEYTPSLLLIPADFILEFPRPVLPNVKVIGPITTQWAKPLPNDLETFLTGNTKVIYVSFGSIIESFSQEKMDILVNAFNQLPYKILWRNKFNIKNLGKHVKVLPWLPQNDILGHSNVVAFLSHCGHNGMYEAAFHGVPILGMPIQFDQFGNLQLILRADIGLGLNFNNLTSNDIINGIQKLLTNER